MQPSYKQHRRNISAETLVRSNDVQVLPRKYEYAEKISIFLEFNLKTEFDI